MTEFMDTGVVNGRIAAFDRRHGQSVFIDGWVVYAEPVYRDYPKTRQGSGDATITCPRCGETIE
jgi:hypothetical protein